MSGHSKWSQIKRQKGVTDAKRGQLFTKLAREIMVAVKQDGPNPESNFQLRLAVENAHSNNMPTENIERAIKRASGGADAAVLIEMTLEGYGPHGVAVLVKALADNRNRSIQEVRCLFTRHGGSLGESGCVSWMFENKGVISVELAGADADELALEAIDAGAEDVNTGDDYLEIYTRVDKMEELRKVIEERSHVVSAEVSMIPKTTVMLDESKALQVLNFIDQLDQLDDVQHVFSNLDFSDETLAKLHSQA